MPYYNLIRDRGSLMPYSNLIKDRGSLIWSSCLFLWRSCCCNCSVFTSGNKISTIKSNKQYTKCLQNKIYHGSYRIHCHNVNIWWWTKTEHIYICKKYLIALLTYWALGVRLSREFLRCCIQTTPFRWWLVWNLKYFKINTMTIQITAGLNWESDFSGNWWLHWPGKNS